MTGWRDFFGRVRRGRVVDGVLVEEAELEGLPPLRFAPANDDRVLVVHMDAMSRMVGMPCVGELDRDGW